MLRPLLITLLSSLSTSVALAQQPPAMAVRAAGPTQHWDYSRFSDGPRSVARPRGASLRRAQALGLGTREAASRLLSGRPLPAWIEAARGQASDRLLWPVEEGHFGRGFGYVRRTRPDLRHNGVDIIAPEGSEVHAVADGIVAYSDNGVRGFGNCVMIVHPNGMVSLYAHSSRTTVQPGWRVHRGERIALVGHTGIAHGPHVHFELRADGHLVDPMPYFGGRPRARRAPHHEPESAEPEADGQIATVGSHEVGSARALATLLGGHVPDALREEAGRLFRNLLWPVRGGQIAQGFVEGGHGGLDIAAESGSAVRAAADGIVVYAGEGLRGLGRSIVLLHRNGWITIYGGNRELHVSPGDHVQRGEWIAAVGESSAGDGPHLHFELRDAGARQDPAPLLVQVPTPD